ncbi:hypothetical protein BDA99DRAFT_600367 [Phascolomyces articulosus]|uniref:Uncharacterized protein n=1 Tax=Phascolomyces articulosus TaxID=60185 RepID=A0AAD5KCR6_9FUNG|nr:hypothetical protein BDA99DRAFT_600367 [Phascolomyces articulosus]
MSDLAYLSAMTSVQPPDDMSTTTSTTTTTPMTTTTSTRQGHSPFRRSLTLSHGAAALLARGFTRSSNRTRSTSNATGEITATREEDQQRREQQQHQPRRATIATTAAVNNASSPTTTTTTTTNTTSTTTPATRTVSTPTTLASTTTTSREPSLHVRIVPNIENPSRCIIFDIVDREMKAGTMIKIGRFAERIPISSDHMSFKSKVVSRSHCEIWVHQDGKLYIRDTSSSSGTFLNHIRLSGANQESPATEIKHGDIVQLGVDYQGGQEEIYRSVKMRFELSGSRKPRPLSFSMSQFNNLRTLSRVASNHGDNASSSLVLVDEESTTAHSSTKPTNNEASQCNSGPLCSNTTNNDSCCSMENSEAPEAAAAAATSDHSSYHGCCTNATTTKTNNNNNNNNTKTTTTTTTTTTTPPISTTTSSHSSHSSLDELPEVDECCICLYALAPFQALFVAPCSHSFHFMCIRSLLQSYPGFQCPICRAYSDLEASVAIEPEEVLQKYGLRCKSFTPPPEAAFEAGHQQTSNASSTSPQSPPPSAVVSSIPSPPPEHASTPPQQHEDQQQQNESNNNHEPLFTPANTTTENTVQHVNTEQEPGRSSDNNGGPSTSTNSGILVTNGSNLVRDATARDRRTVFVSDDMDVIEIPPVQEYDDEDEPSSSPNEPSSYAPIPSPTAPAEPTPSSIHHQQQQQQQQRPIRRSVRAPASTAHPERRLSAANLMEKLKMTFFEKRKSSAIMSRNEQQRGRKRSNKPRPLSYPNFLIRPFSRDDDEDDEDDSSHNSSHSRNNNNNHANGASPSRNHHDVVVDVQIQPTPSSSSTSPPPTPISPTSQHQQQSHYPLTPSALSFNSLSRQSTTHLSEIQEESTDGTSCHHHSPPSSRPQQAQPMAIDT